MKDFTILTKEDAVRAQDSARYNPAIDSGYFGRVMENQCARPKSRKKCVSSAGKADVHIKYNGRYIPAEVKTNGGRIDSLIDGTNKSKFLFVHPVCNSVDDRVFLPVGSYLSGAFGSDIKTV